MPFLSIEFNLEALRKLAERGISVDEVTEVFQTTPVVWIENPNPRTDHSRWHVMTAWDSTDAQVRI